jgi:hypothetical protein
MTYDTDRKFASVLTPHIVGKTVAAVTAEDSGTPVHLVYITFTDGTRVELMGEHDEGFTMKILDIEP